VDYFVFILISSYGRCMIRLVFICNLLFCSCCFKSRFVNGFDVVHLDFIFYIVFEISDIGLN
jgi:hypothetical protein